MTRTISQRFEDVSSTGPHITVIVNATDETVELSGGARPVHVKDGSDFLHPGFESSGCEPIAKPVSFFDCPFTFKWVDSEAIFTKVVEDFVK